nr:3-oxoadipate enol-lactonase [Wenxinia saemankumensis]
MPDLTVPRGDVRLHVLRIDGSADPGAPSLVLANSLGTHLALWDAVLPHLPPGLRVIRWDKRGHGRSSAPPAPYAMGALVSDAEAVMEATGTRDAVFAGLSIGGMIAQGLAVKRPDLVRALVLSNTAARIGTKALWEDRIAAVRRHGLEPLADGILDRWFSRGFRRSDAVAPWREMLLSTTVEGYCGCCAAIAGTDFLTPTSGLRLPVLGIAGSEDGATPPDLVRETVDLVPGSRFELMRGAGHLPPVEAPEAYAALLTGFLDATGHL